MQSAAPVPDIFKTVSTPADAIRRLSFFVLTITGLIFAVVFSLLVYAVWKYRHRGADDNREPPQVYGSNQVELAWTVVPVLIVLVLFFATGACDSIGPGRDSPARRRASHGCWPSILVGISLSYPWRRHRQRTARSGQRPRESHADFRQTSFRRHRPQLLVPPLAGKPSLIPIVLTPYGLILTKPECLSASARNIAARSAQRCFFASTLTPRNSSPPGFPRRSNLRLFLIPLRPGARYLNNRVHQLP